MTMPAAAAMLPPVVEPKAAEILERIKGVFAAKGFDGASMQDLARAAGISAGNFYRYFPSKSAIVEAMVAHDLAEVEADFARIMQAASPQAALRSVFRRRLEEVEADQGPLWAEIEAAAARRPEIAAISSRMIEEIRRHLLRVFARIAGVPDDEAARRFQAEADLVMLLVKGASVQVCARGRIGAPPDLALRRLVLRHLDIVLAEIAGRSIPALTLPE